MHKKGAFFIFFTFEIASLANVLGLYLRKYGIFITYVMCVHVRLGCLKNFETGRTLMKRVKCMRQEN